MSKPRSSADPLERTVIPETSDGAQIAPAKTFGRYQLLQELGQGNMGVVYLAEDLRLGRKVALKIPKKANWEEPEALARFYREAKAMAALRHNNICPVYDVGAIDGTHYLTMAYIPGKPISSYLNKDKLPAARQVALLIRKIALALEEAHQRGVVHRDLKPSNVMLDDRGEPIVMDFGLARHLNTAESARLTQSGAILGTPAYMSPEQVSGDAARIGPATDVYALGVMMYQLLTGILPFSGPSMLVFSQIMTQPPKKPSLVKPDVHPTLEAICLKMMAKEIPDRYAGMQEVIAVLADFLKTCPASGRESTLPLPPSTQAMTDHLPDGNPAPASRMSRQLWFWLIAAGLGVVLLVSLVTMAGRNHQSQDRVAADNETDSTPTDRATQPVPAPIASQDRPSPAIAPFDAAQAQAHQRAWSQHSGLPIAWTNPLGMKFVLIPPGEILTGSSQEEIDELVRDPEVEGKGWAVDLLRSEVPQRRVSFAEPYYIGETEVTVGQFREFIDSTGYQTVAEHVGGGISFEVGFKDFEQRPEFVWNNSKYTSFDDFPVRFLAIQDAQKFVAWLSEKYHAHYAVPTEAQWEYACRAGTTTRWYFEPADAEKYEWLGRTAVQPVGQKLGNPFGVRDMLGNVEELTLDRNHSAIVRGGTEAAPLIFARSASRGVPWEIPRFLVGLRVVVDGDLKAAVQEQHGPTDSTANPGDSQ